jgi:hypothetical protein
VLVAQEHHAVPQQRGPELGQRGRLDVTADPDTADDRADHATDLGHLDALEILAGGQGHRAVE